MLASLAQHRLARANVSLELADYDRKVLAKCPPAVFVCNQLLPGLDEWLLLAVLAERFGDTSAQALYPYPTPAAKLLRPYLLLPQRRYLSDSLLQIRFNKRLVRRVKKGTAVGVAVDFSDNPIASLGRNLLRPQVLRQLRKCGLPVVPVHLVADHPTDVATLLLRSLSNLPFVPGPTPLRVSVRIGQPIPPEEIERFDRNRLWTQYLQAKIFALGSTLEVRPELVEPPSPEAKQQPIAEPVATELVAADIAALRPEQKVTSRGQFDVYVASFLELPHAMFEIARLREITFRAVGEGTGRSRDLDNYDLHYLQLVIWDREAQTIVGGYRLGLGDHIFKRLGVNGFYTHSLFKLRPGLYPTLQQAIELGRSYVVPEYQRHRLPLFLLWKGILHYLLAHPQYRYLYGPVSISKHYSEVSKGVIVEFVKQYFFDHELARHVRPRKAFRVKNRVVNVELLAEHLHGQFDELENFVEQIEPWHLPVPVLLRQYLKQNARFIAFNVDPLFSDCLDGLMLLDVKDLPEGTVEMLK